MRKSLIALSLAMMPMASPAFAACYSQMLVPGQVVCPNNNTNSADFEMGCKWQQPSWQAIQVACPPVQRLTTATGNRTGGGGNGGGDRGGHYVDTNNDGRTDTFRSGAGWGSDTPGAKTSKNSYTGNGVDGYGGTLSKGGSSSKGGSTGKGSSSGKGGSSGKGEAKK